MCAVVVLGATTAQALAGRTWSTVGPVTAEVEWVGARADPASVTLRVSRDGDVASFRALQRGGWGIPTRGPIVVVRDLDRDGQVDVLVNLTTGGVDCCLRTHMVRWVPAEGRHRLTTHDWGAAGYRVRDLNGDGRPEFVSADTRWAPATGPRAGARLPVRIWNIRAGRLVDRTRSFRPWVRADMAGHWAAIAASERRGVSPRAAISAYLADAHLMGRPTAAWARVRTRYTAPGAERFFVTLQRRLVAYGYSTPHSPDPTGTSSTRTTSSFSSTTSS